MRRGSDESTKTTLNRILTQRELRDAIQKLLRRPWFQRVWVIQGEFLMVESRELAFD
jgi:hypothetical protein